MQRLDLRRTSYLRQLDGHLSTGKRIKYAGEIRRLPTGFGKIEHVLVNGRLADPRPIGQGDGWIDTCQWDFLIYMQTTAPGSSGKCYPTFRAARRKSGLFDGLPKGRSSEDGRKWERQAALEPALVASGFIQPIEGPHHPSYPWKQLMLAPSWPNGSTVAVPSGIPKTNATLREHQRSWFSMPEAIMNDLTWHQIGSHAGRRVIAALYAFFDDVTYGAVNPNHLCIRDDQLEVSDAFLLACGEEASPQEVMSAIAWLWDRRHIFPMAAVLEAGKPYPAGEGYVTWSAPVAKNTPHHAVVFVPWYVPTGQVAE